MPSRRTVTALVPIAAFFATFLGGALLAPTASAATAPDMPVYPGLHWAQAKRPEDLGWSSEKLNIAKVFADRIGSDSVMIVDNGIVVAQWGETSLPINVRSVRKSFLSALYGNAIARGDVSRDATLADLKIDDTEPSLTPLERTARVVDLLRARSGIYHDALYESPGMKARKPARGSHPPRSFWVYNNWDFNALGTIYEQQTHQSIYEAFAREIARPIGMEDYAVGDQQYATGPESIHRAYPFRMSARDMARFGLLYLRNGRWRDHQAVPAAWVRESTTSYSVADGDAEYGYSGYGYLWWVAANGNHVPGADLPDGSFSARGAGGHHIVVVPAYNLVIVHRVRNELPNRELTDTHVSIADFGELLGLILAARPGQGAGQPRLATQRSRDIY